MRGAAMQQSPHFSFDLAHERTIFLRPAVIRAGGCFPVAKRPQGFAVFVAQRPKLGIGRVQVLHPQRFLRKAEVQPYEPVIRRLVGHSDLITPEINGRDVATLASSITIVAAQFRQGPGDGRMQPANSG